MELSEVMNADQIKLEMKARTKAEALTELTELLYQAGNLSDRAAFLEDVYYRETEGLTGIGNGIAIPHGKSKYVEKTSIAVGRTAAGIEWETVDDEPVRFFVLFAVKEEDSTTTHVKLLSKVAARLADPVTCARLLETKSAAEMIELFMA